LSIGSISINDVLTTYPIGTFAGFEISKHFIIRAGVLGGLTITTYNDGVEGRVLLVHLVWSQLILQCLMKMEEV
jgi:hypothetical protein